MTACRSESSRSENTPRTASFDSDENFPSSEFLIAYFTMSVDQPTCAQRAGETLECGPGAVRRRGNGAGNRLSVDIALVLDPKASLSERFAEIADDRARHSDHHIRFLIDIGYFPELTGVEHDPVRQGIRRETVSGPGRANSDAFPSGLDHYGGDAPSSTASTICEGSHCLLPTQFFQDDVPKPPLPSSHIEPSPLFSAVRLPTRQKRPACALFLAVQAGQ